MNSSPLLAAHRRHEIRLRRSGRRFLRGLLEPLRALRLVATDPALRRTALVPPAALALVCAAYAWLASDGRGVVRCFYESFAALAPVPSIFFSSYYARFAVLVRERLGLGPSRPVSDRLTRILMRALSQVVLIAIGMSPWLMLVHLAPRAVSWAVVPAVTALWALHWIVIDAFDGARVLQPGETEADVARQLDEAPDPWFVRAPRGLARWLPRVLAWPLERFAALCARLSWSWRDDIALVERHPDALGGFALGTALVLATPVLNLLFRPVVLAAAVRLGATLAEEQEAAAAAATATANASGEGTRRRTA